MHQVRKLAGVFAAFVCLRAGAAPAPAWIAAPSRAYPADRYVSAVGAGASREAAELEAVKGIASVFGQDVHAASSASLRMEQFQADGTSATTAVSSLDQRVLRQVDADGLVGVDVRESYEDEKHGIWYVLAVLDRPRASGLYASMIQRNDALIARLLGQMSASGNEYSLENFARLDFACEAAAATDGYLRRLAVIDAAAAEALGGARTGSVELADARRRLAAGMPVAIVVDGDEGGRVAKAFAAVFASAGLATAAASNERYQLSCTVDYTERADAAGRVKYVEYTVAGALRDTRVGEDLLPVSYAGREGSTTFQNARMRAAAAIAKKVQAEFKGQFSEYVQAVYAR